MRIDDGKEMHAGLRHVAAVNKKSMRTCAIAGFPVGTMVAHLENSESKARKLSMYRSMDLKYAVPRCGANSARAPQARKVHLSCSALARGAPQATGSAEDRQ